MTDFQQAKEREIIHELLNILKELCGFLFILLIPRNENCVGYFIKEVIEILKTPISPCFVFVLFLQLWWWLRWGKMWESWLFLPERRHRTDSGDLFDSSYGNIDHFGDWCLHMLSVSILNLILSKSEKLYHPDFFPPF